jgi:hypothetical protein
VSGADLQADILDAGLAFADDVLAVTVLAHAETLAH